MVQETQTGALSYNLDGWDGEGDGELQREQDVCCIPIADSC